MPADARGDDHRPSDIGLRRHRLHARTASQLVAAVQTAIEALESYCPRSVRLVLISPRSIRWKHPKLARAACGSPLR